jgi:hypothetical protein
MKRIEFTLEMPNAGSWNGRWSGEGKNYSIVRRLTNDKCAELKIGENGNSWYHGWNDGWGARVNARIVKAGERLKRSDGFCGYSWMVSNILQYGATKKPESAASGAEEQQ